MSKFNEQASRPDPEFYEVMRAADPDIISELAIITCEAVIDHQKMKNALYWLMNDGTDPEADADLKRQFEHQVTDLAGKLEVHGEPMQIYEVVKRYADQTPIGRQRRG